MAEQTIDLHTHSVKSDGSMTPSELVRHAKEAGLAAISLTDHDGVSGVAEAAAEGQKIGLEVVPGIELSVQSKAETHILGYYIDIAHPALTKKLEEIRQVLSLIHIFWAAIITNGAPCAAMGWMRHT